MLANSRFFSFSIWPFFFVLFSLLACSPTDASSPAAGRPEQSIQVSLDPAQSRLTGESRIQFPERPKTPVELFLSDGARLSEVRWGADSADHRFSGSILTVEPPEGGESNPELTIAYAAVFDDPAPVRPLNMDNPGHGVSGTISDRGALLLGGSGWYPVLSENWTPRHTVSVDAPEGVLAVTAGDLVAHKTEDGRTVSVWKTESPTEILALSAGRYEMREKKSGPVRVMTYFLPETQGLSDAYLDASAKYIGFYAQIFGPYPFSKFAVVENFFPTGYGFPSYTLMGGRVLRLPFIISTSLGHEIAHCWWGNGVNVDFSSGNWSEGLTTYVSDYLYKEEDSKEAAREYRLKMVRGYTALVPPDGGFPLSEFRSRVDRPSQAIGYHKAAMVFHMLRRRVGEGRFWETLGEVFRTHKFQTASWADFQAAFEAAHDEPLDAFFRQWIQEPGAPVVSLGSVSSSEKSGDWIVEGRLRQTAPGWDLRVPVRVETENGNRREIVALTETEAEFRFEVEDKPVRLSVDPDADVMRRLHPREVPPTVNRLKGSETVLVVVANSASPALAQTAEMLAISLGLRRYRVVAESDLGEGQARGHSLLLIGRPSNPDLLPALPETVSLTSDGVELLGETYTPGAGAFFGVFPHPGNSEKVAALFLADGDGAPVVARKITHYGAYSFLAFRETQNRAKGTWPVTDSPLIHHF
jgi:hypothetical protein